MEEKNRNSARDKLRTSISDQQGIVRGINGPNTCNRVRMLWETLFAFFHFAHSIISGTRKRVRLMGNENPATVIYLCKEPI